MTLVDSTKLPIDRAIYVDSLVWRQAEVRSRLESLRLQLQAFQKEETELMQEIRAIDLLLGAAKANGMPVQPRLESAMGGPEPASRTMPDFSPWGPTAREIYQCTYNVIHDAGVPLHYRVIADHVREKVSLSGADPGATLIAHLHRAQEIFPRVGRGIYGLTGMISAAAAPPVETAPRAAPTHQRRRRVRRRHVK